MPNHWKNFLILYSIQTLHLLDFMSIAPLGAILVKNGDISSEAISYALAAYSTSAIISSICLSSAGKDAPKRTLLQLLLFFTISQIIFFFPLSSHTFVIAKFVSGMTGGLMNAIAFSQLINIESGSRTGVWNGRIQTAQSIATIIGIPLCIMLVNSFGARTYFSLTTFLVLVTATTLNQSSFIKTSSAQSAENLFRVFRSNWEIFVSGLLCYLAAFLFISHMSNYLVNFLNIHPDTLSLSFAFSGILTLFFAGPLGGLAEHRNARILLGVSLVLIILPQLGFIFLNSEKLLLFVLLPSYLALSNARAIFQRALILQKKNQDSYKLHLLNNIAIRSGIILSGMVLSVLASNSSHIGNLFQSANALALLANVLLLIGLIITSLFDFRNTKQTL